MKKIIFISFLSVLFYSSTWAQKLQLLDDQNQLPIVAANYQYASQSGISDEEGFIEINFQSGEVLKLSHLNYGTWELGEAELKIALKNGKILRAPRIIALQPITVIALKMPVSNAEQGITIRQQDRLAHDGGAILNQIPAISSIRKSAAYGFDPVLRGFKYEQLNIVIDGAQSMNAACPNRMDPPSSQIAPNMTARIEVLKGPHALRFGNSFGGTINFISLSPQFTEVSKVYGRISSGIELNGEVFRNEGNVGLSGKHYNVGIFAAWAQGTDYADGDGNEIPANFKRGSFGTNLALKVTKNQTLQLSATYNLARDVDFPAIGMDLRTDDTWLFNAKHTLNLQGKSLKNWTTNLYLSAVEHLMDNLLRDLNPRMANVATPASTRSFGGRTEGTWQFMNANLYLGADLRSEQAEGKRSREFLMGPMAGQTRIDNAWQSGQINKGSVFGEYQHLGKKWLAVLAARLELNQSLINDAATEFVTIYSDAETLQVNPSLSAGISYQWTPEFSSGLWLGRAQRSGSLSERFINYFTIGQDPYEVLGNPLLKPEVNNQLDLKLSYQTEKTALQADFFVAYLQDYIVGVINADLTPRLPTSPGVRQFENVAEAFKTGFELSWQQSLGRGLSQSLSMAYTFAEDLTREAPLPEIAPLDIRWTLAGSFFQGRLQPEVRFRHVITQTRISEDFGERRTPSFNLIDIQVNYGLSKLISLTAGVNNLFDVGYYEHLNRTIGGASPRPIFAPGRNIFMSFALKFP